MSDEQVAVPPSAYGPLVLTSDGRTLRPGDEGFDEASAQAVALPAIDSLKDWRPLGWAWGDIEVVMHEDGSGEMTAEWWGTFDA